MQKMLYREAVCQALDEEMARDKNVFNIGEDVGVIGGNFKCTKGLMEKYGDLRCKDSPIAEQGFIGMCVGAAIRGLRPVAELMFGDFMFVCFDQIANQMAKITYMSGGKVHVPMTIRMPIGGGRSSAAQHSQTPITMVANMPGMKVVMPSNGYEAKGLLKTAIRDNNPVIFMEHKMMYTTECEIPDEEYYLPIGKADINSLTLSLNRQQEAQRNYISALQNYWLSYYKIRKLTLHDFETGVSLSNEFEYKYGL